MPRRKWLRIWRFTPMAEPESVIAGRFNLRLNQPLAAYKVSESEYLTHILPLIPVANIWNAEVAEKRIREYRNKRGG